MANEKVRYVGFRIGWFGSDKEPGGKYCIIIKSGKKVFLENGISEDITPAYQIYVHEVEQLIREGIYREASEDEWIQYKRQFSKGDQSGFVKEYPKGPVNL